jgi:hypothetical protein
VRLAIRKSLGGWNSRFSPPSLADYFPLLLRDIASIMMQFFVAVNKHFTATNSALLCESSHSAHRTLHTEFGFIGWNQKNRFFQ